MIGNYSDDFGADLSSKRMKTFLDMPFRPILSSSTTFNVTPSHFVPTSFAPNELQSHSVNINDTILRSSSSDSAFRIQKQVQRLEGIRAPLVELDDNFIETMLIGLKENKKITNNRIPSFHSSPKLQNPMVNQPQSIPMHSSYSYTPNVFQPSNSNQIMRDSSSSPTPTRMEIQANTAPQSYIVNNSFHSNPLSQSNSFSRDILSHEDRESSSMNISPSSSPLRSPSPSTSNRDGSSNIEMYLMQDKTRDTRWKEHFQELCEF
jgi:hypothetical protein